MILSLLSIIVLIHITARNRRIIQLINEMVITMVINRKRKIIVDSVCFRKCKNLGGGYELREIWGTKLLGAGESVISVIISIAVGFCFFESNILDSVLTHFF